MPDHKPLWQVMEAAFLAGRSSDPSHCDRTGYAAEILALRDRLVPLTPEPPLGATGTDEELQDWMDWNTRDNIWWELTEEAEIAQTAQVVT
jgi:hypothetical protein